MISKSTNSGKMNPGYVWMLFWLMLTTPAAALDIRVRLGQDVSSMTIGSSTPAAVMDGKGQSLGQISALEGFSASAVSGGVSFSGKKAWQIVVKPKDDGFVYAGDRWYRGVVRLIRSGSGFTVVNELNMEDYLASVIGKEMYPSWPQEALKAQAVASRSYALFHKQHPKSKFFDVVNTTTSQVYAGLAGEANSTQTAVKSTAGEVLAYNGQLIEAVFHAASGGHTENSEDIWMSAVPYLRGVPDFDQTAPVYQWTQTFTATQLRQRIPGIGDIVSMTPAKSTPSGRIQTLKVQGTAGSLVMKGVEARKALGLKSTLFTAKPTFGLVAGTEKSSSKPAAFEISGRGSGHGLGLSQWGAYGMASQGKTYRDILTHYFQGTTVKIIH